MLVALANVPEHFLATLAAWKLGACAVSVSPRLTAQERDDLLALARPAARDRGLGRGSLGPCHRHGHGACLQLTACRTPTRPGAVSREGDPRRAPRRAAPKLIVDPRPRAFVPWSAGGTLGRIEGLRPHQVQLIAGPLYHDGPFFWSHYGLFEHHRLVVMERFDAALAVDLIERHQVHFACLVPTMVRRSPAAGHPSRATLSIEAIFHAAAPCPPG